MKRPFPFKVHFNGEALIPDARTLDYCRRELGPGELITLERNEERSDLSHNHYFAWLHEAWLQLPESLAREYPTEEFLRTKALVLCGYCHERYITCASEEQAQAIAAFVQPMNPYAIVNVHGDVVHVLTAKSQSRQSMNKKEFQESKDKVIDFVANLIGVSPDTLKRNAGKAA